MATGLFFRQPSQDNGRNQSVLQTREMTADNVKKESSMSSQIDAADKQRIDAWEDDGGARLVSQHVSPVPLKGTTSQVEWAERIRSRVDAEFDRVASSFRTVARKLDRGKVAEIAAILAILEEKRAEVMSREQAGYFIHDWQEIGDQVRQLIFHDARYPSIRARMGARRRAIG